MQMNFQKQDCCYHWVIYYIAGDILDSTKRQTRSEKTRRSFASLQQLPWSVFVCAARRQSRHRRTSPTSVHSEGETSQFVDRLYPSRQGTQAAANSNLIRAFIHSFMFVRLLFPFSINLIERWRGSSGPTYTFLLHNLNWHRCSESPTYCSLCLIRFQSRNQIECISFKRFPSDWLSGLVVMCLI